MLLKKMIFTCCILTLLLLTACGTDKTEESTNTANNSNTTTNHSSTTDDITHSSNHSNSTKHVNVTETAVSLTEAVNIFKEAHPEAQIESVELDTDFGNLQYDIGGFDTSKEYEMTIDATTKEVLENEQDKDDYLDFSAIIDPAKAIEIASANLVAKELSPAGWSLEADDGKQHYTIEYEDNSLEVEIELDAVTGEVCDIELDN